MLTGNQVKGFKVLEERMLNFSQWLTEKKNIHWKCSAFDWNLYRSRVLIKYICGKRKVDFFISGRYNDFYCLAIMQLITITPDIWP